MVLLIVTALVIWVRPLSLPVTTAPLKFWSLPRRHSLSGYVPGPMSKIPSSPTLYFIKNLTIRTVYGINFRGAIKGKHCVNNSPKVITSLRRLNLCHVTTHKFWQIPPRLQIIIIYRLLSLQSADADPNPRMNRVRTPLMSHSTVTPSDRPTELVITSLRVASHETARILPAFYDFCRKTDLQGGPIKRGQPLFLLVRTECVDKI